MSQRIGFPMLNIVRISTAILPILARSSRIARAARLPPTAQPIGSSVIQRCQFDVPAAAGACDNGLLLAGEFDRDPFTGVGLAPHWHGKFALEHPVTLERACQFDFGVNGDGKGGNGEGNNSIVHNCEASRRAQHPPLGAVSGNGLKGDSMVWFYLGKRGEGKFGFIRAV